MIRTALRLSTIAAITNGGAQPYPTLAGGQVYDSRQDAIENLVAEGRYPVIIVRTDTDQRNPRQTNSRQIELRIEMSVVTALKNSAGDWQVGWPEIDAELEAFLDLMEWQVKVALMGDGKWATWWQDAWSPWDQEISTPLWADPKEERTRLAIRELLLRPSQVCSDDSPRAVIEGDVVAAPTLPASLIKVFDKIAKEGVGDLKASATQLRGLLEAQTLPSTPVYPPLKLVRSNWLEPAAKTPAGQEANADIEAELYGPVPPE